MNKQAQTDGKLQSFIDSTKQDLDHVRTMAVADNIGTSTKERIIDELAEEAHRKLMKKLKEKQQ